MIGIRDLTRHMLYVAKKEGHSADSFYKGGFDKLVFVAFCYCLKAGMKIRYDILFKKARYGSTSEGVKRILGNRYGRYISFDAEKALQTIDYDGELNKKIINIINLESNETFSMARYIIHSQVYIDSEYGKVTGSEEEKQYERDLLFRDNSTIWTLEEIYKIANADIDDKTDLRIPLNSKEYSAIYEYLTLVKKSYRDEESKHGFTFDNILELRSISQSIIDSVEAHGAYLVD